MSATSLLDELRERDGQVAAAKARVRKVENEAAAARTEAAEARDALVEAYADGDETQAAKLVKAQAKADTRAAEPWDARREGADRAARRMQAERDSWIGENVVALMGELEPRARAATQAIVAAGEALEAARLQWHGVAQEVERLLCVSPDSDARTPMVDPVDRAIRDALRATAEMPLPMPQGRQDVRLAPGHEPDAERVHDPATRELHERFARTLVRANDPDPKAA